MAIQPQKYVRKPFEVQAVEVTAENIQEVADWCGGVIETDTEGPRSGEQEYIKVNVKKPLSTRQTHAYYGDWVLLATRGDVNTPAGFKVYTPKAFVASFQLQVDNMLDVVERMDKRVTEEEKAEEQDEVLFSDMHS